MSFLKDYFTYSKKERSGIIALFLLMIISIFTYFSIDYFYFNEKEYDYSTYKNEIDEFEKNQIIVAKYEKKKFAKYSYSKKKYNSKLFSFNPNIISKDSLILLGIYPNICDRIVKFRNAGGQFKKGSDLMKIYGFNEKQFKKLENYILIPTEENKAPVIKEIKHQLAFNLNLADTTELKKLKGIGSKLSNRIIEYRIKLGGFYSPDQLLEVYGLKPEVFNEIKQRVYIDNEYQKINVNIATAAELQAHPYIKKWNIANAIVNYRDKHGKYNKIDDLLKTDLVNEELCRKIAPYLIFE